MSFGAIIATGDDNALLSAALTDCLIEVRVEQSLDEPTRFGLRVREDFSAGEPMAASAPELKKERVLTIAVDSNGQKIGLLRDPGLVLGIAFYRIMQHYGLNNNLWSVIAAIVTFATPYAIFIFQEYGRSIPLELDESARIDGASSFQIYFRIYLPLMAPALVAVGTYALLLAWNGYLYQFLLLSNKQSMTVPVALAQFLNSDVAPWNYMMATAIIYALPPIATYYAFRNRMSSGLTMGGVKG